MFGEKRLTLILESTEIRALVVQGQRIRRWERALLPEGAVRQGQIVQPKAFGEIVAELVDAVKGPRRRAVVGLSSQRSLVRILDLPPVPTRLLDETVRREARRELPLPLEGLYLSWQVIDDRTASGVRVFTVGVPKEIIDTCMVGLRAARVRPVAMDLKPLALVRAVNLPNVLIVDLEKGNGSLTLVRDDIPYIVRSIPLSTEESGWIDLIVSEIQRTLEFYHTTLSASLPAWTVSLCLTGALAEDERVREQVGSLWPLVDPAPPIPVPDEFPLLSYLGNIGLALKRLPS
ncbi:MAG TPA: pilus assembly protein PilM [Thermoflexia bacterium]|jgi:type IV pilus assembly protein PilM|nr:pilus assembly protein PilM [Thermoflexia bacterium]